MQRRGETNHLSAWNNVKWLIASIGLALFVWIIATLDRDPIDQRIFLNIPIQLEPEAGLVVTDFSRDVANVTVRAPQSTLDQLDQDDILIFADLAERGPGEHNVNLEVNVSRRAISDTTPRRIRVELEESLEKLVPVQANVTSPLPRGFEIEGGSPVFDTNQALVQGPLSQVERVVAVQVPLNLTQRRNAFTDELRLLPVDSDGNEVENVEVEPAMMTVSVPIRTRSDVRQVSVTPNILAETLPTGYALSSIDYNPQTIFISGPPDALENAPGTVFTEPISLTDRTNSFEGLVNIELPSTGLFVVGDQTVTVSIGITPLLSSRQFDGVPVEIIGLDARATATISPQEVTVLITGPQNAIQTMADESVRVVVDLNEMSSGNYQLVPDVRLRVDTNVLTNISVLPAEIDVNITSESTPTPP